MTTSPVCVPLSSSRSMNSLLVSASASSKVGCDTCESSASARPAAPHEGPGLAITPAQIKQRHDPPTNAAAAPPMSVMNSRRRSGRDARFIARPPHRTVRAAFPHTACMGLSLSRVHHAIFVARCYSILLFDPRREHSSIPTAHCRRRRAQWRSRTALLQRRRRLVLDGREHGGRLPVIGWSAAR
jgi:hypothetical protein